MQHLHLLLPLAAAIAFAIGSMVFKRSFEEGAGLAHALIVNNVILSLIFFPFLWVDAAPVPWKFWYLPALTAVTFVTGHLLNVVSLRVGDVSVATPLLGAKVIFVAVAGWLFFNVRLQPYQWIASALATAGVVVMGATDFRPGGRPGLTSVLALGCAAAFALTDVTIQAWSSSFGVIHFLALQFGALGILSAALLPMLGWRSLRAPAAAWKWIFAAAAFSALQAIIITTTIGVWHDAAGVNVVFATRGLWSIALVWFLGHRIGNKERHTAGHRRMGIRFAGAALIVAAVVLASQA